MIKMLTLPQTKRNKNENSFKLTNINNLKKKYISIKKKIKKK
jgi:hypothetical protein